MTSEHLRRIDAGRWPAVAAPPDDHYGMLAARAAEARFAAVCRRAGLSLTSTPEHPCDLVVEHSELFVRLARRGWLGLAESYMAGEWRTDALAKVLRALISTRYRPAVVPGTRIQPGEYTGGQLPAELTQLSSPGTASLLCGLFDSGVPTRVRTAVDSHAPKTTSAGEQPARYFVDMTDYSAPVAVERADLGPAQRRAAELLLDAVGCRVGTHLLEHPASGPLVAEGAQRRGATVDVLAGDADYAGAIATLLGSSLDSTARDDVAVATIDSALPRRVRGRYDAIVSVDHLEQLQAHDRPDYLRQLDRLLAPEGRLAVHMAVATPEMSATARRALGPLRGYIWPALDYPTLDTIYGALDRNTRLRVVAQSGLGSHWGETLRLEAEQFSAHFREAAADGFDPVFRRLWEFQFALRRALVDLGMLDMVQLTAVHRRG